MTGDVIWGLMIPFIGTAAGSAMVYLMRGQMRPAIQKILTGFAAGVMIAASVWSLLLPAIDKSEELGLIGWLPPAVTALRQRQCKRTAASPSRTPRRTSTKNSGL